MFINYIRNIDDISQDTQDSTTTHEKNPHLRFPNVVLRFFEGRLLFLLKPMFATVSVIFRMASITFHRHQAPLLIIPNMRANSERTDTTVKAFPKLGRHIWRSQDQDLLCDGNIKLGVETYIAYFGIIQCTSPLVVVLDEVEFKEKIGKTSVLHEV